MAKLDISNTTPEQRRAILKYAADVRKFEIERFWQRSLFFWGFISAAFIAYAALYDKKPEILPLIIARFGFLCSLAWTLQNRGSKYWQEAWEQKVEAVERDVLGAPLFSNREPKKDRLFWGAWEFSVSKLAIALSDLTAFVWVTLAIIAFPEKLLDSTVCLAILIILSTLAFAFALIYWGRSSRSPTNKTQI